MRLVLRDLELPETPEPHVQLLALPSHQLLEVLDLGLESVDLVFVVLMVLALVVEQALLFRTKLALQLPRSKRRRRRT